MRLYFILPLLACLSFSARADTVYKTYVNQRYGFAIDYPDYLQPQGEAANGDGQVFLSPKRDAELRVYARACIEEWDTTPAEFLAKAERNKAKDGRQITYHAKGKHFAVVSGIKDGNNGDKNGGNKIGNNGQQIFYEKLITDGKWCSLFQWTYASSNREKYDEATKRIAASFTP
ncbi:hypothetical protein H8L32_00500 [Undibacterium sp. CY18W]|uniref:Uncharacterized protein n=1 Tax=Undibacterium hunanense TaxID=2762292 RepID=A0ABR6ZJ76_9BURK|nr:hypothetical protein [Undibacterium hunanense]MBC3915950.1 hypothetical protein [Undibacterium hunanense]